MIYKFFWLVFCHTLADAALQTERMALCKGIVLRYMLSHCVIYTGVVSLGLIAFGNFAIWKALLLFASHFLIDTFLHSKNDIKKIGYIGWVDQALHLLVLGVVV